MLLTKLEAPSVKKTKDPEERVIFDTAGKSTSTISKFEEMMYNKRTKKWIQDDQKLETTITFLYKR